MAAPGRSIKERLRDGEAVVGCWLELFSPIATEIAAQAGYDFLLVDREHGPGSFLDSVPLVQVIEGQGAAAMMRLPSNDPIEIKRALDIGVTGLMIPSVNTAAEAAAAVAACRYPPKGSRGMAAVIVRAARYGVDWQAYMREIDDRLLVIAQIESAEAVENAAAIAAVEGVDLLFVGPFDLSANLGHLGEPDHPEVVAQIRRVEAAAKTAGKHLGGIATPARGVAVLLEAGYRYLLCDVDSVLLRDAARASVAAMRKALAER